MPKVSELSAGVPTTDESELIAAVQGTTTVKLTLAQALALRQPYDVNLEEIAALTGDGYPYRDALGNWSLVPIAGTVGPVGPAGPAGPAGAPGPTGPMFQLDTVVVPADTGAAAGTSSAIYHLSPVANGLGLSLPVISPAMDGIVVIVKRLTGGVKELTVTPFAPNTVDGAASIDLWTQYESVTLVAVYVPGASFWSIV